MAAADCSLSTGVSLRGGYMHVEGVRLRDIQNSLAGDFTCSSPVYVYSKAEIVSNVEAYTAALNAHRLDYILGYSLKANYNPHLLRLMKAEGCAAVTVSGGEIQLALREKVDPARIIFNGNGKQAWELELALEHGCLINVDSGFDLENVVDVVKRTGGGVRPKAQVLLRLNPDIDAEVHPFLATGLSASKFGIVDSQLNEVLGRILEEEDVVELVGLHCHLGSTIDKVEVFQECLDVMLTTVAQIRAMGFGGLRYVNLGGGLGIDYRQHAHRTEPREGQEQQQRRPLPKPRDLIEAVQEKLRGSGLCLILEPGRSLVGSAGVLLCKVTGVKDHSSTRYIVVDGAMTEILRPSIYGAYHHIELTEPTTTAPREIHHQRQLYDVVGPVCECADFVGKSRLLERPHDGCGLAVLDAGAYCSSMGSVYNLRMKPAEVLVDGDQWKLIRRPDDLCDVLRPFYEGI